MLLLIYRFNNVAPSVIFVREELAAGEHPLTFLICLVMKKRNVSVAYC